MRVRPGTRVRIEDLVKERESDGGRNERGDRKGEQMLLPVDQKQGIHRREYHMPDTGYDRLTGRGKTVNEQLFA